MRTHRTIAVVAAGAAVMTLLGCTCATQPSPAVKCVPTVRSAPALLSVASLPPVIVPKEEPRVCEVRGDLIHRLEKDVTTNSLSVKLVGSPCFTGYSCQPRTASVPCATPTPAPAAPVVPAPVSSASCPTGNCPESPFTAELCVAGEFLGQCYTLTPEEMLGGPELYIPGTAAAQSAVEPAETVAASVPESTKSAEPVSSKPVAIPEPLKTEPTVAEAMRDVAPIAPIPAAPAETAAPAATELMPLMPQSTEMSETVDIILSRDGALDESGLPMVELPPKLD